MKSKLEEMAEKGASIAEMAAAIRRSPATVHRRLRRMGLARGTGRKRALDALAEAELYIMVKTHKLCKDEAAHKYGVSERTVERIMRKQKYADRR